MDLHPDVRPLAALLGRWVGEGAGEYPTIEPFRYREEVAFGHAGKPFLSYVQGTVNLATGQPAHAESGYLRPAGPGRAELVVAHPTGLAEVATGEVEQAGEAAAPARLTLHLAAATVTGTPTAKDVASIERRIEVDGDVLRYTVAMGAVRQPHQHHLAATLHRQTS